MSLASGTTRRTFLKTSLATAGTAALSRRFALAQAPAKYRRYNVTSPGGQKALASYAKAVKIMLNLPPEHPHNWFRNAFVHMMDCPHGNWWFYVWHRGYVGLFEQTVRKLSEDPTFAFPYWDWSVLPQIPDAMFDGVLTPTDSAYEPFTKDLDTFTAYIQPSLRQYWDKLNRDQLAQLDARGYKSFELMWNEVTGFNPKLDPPRVDPENMAFAKTSAARYLTRSNPKLDADVTFNCSPKVVYPGLLPTSFYDPITLISFNSSRTTSHNTPPPDRTVFSTLEGQPHNSTHNYIGGVGNIPGGPYGNMTNNLSPVDPLFFLHHSNIDRLWDVWTRKQQALGLPYLPEEEDFKVWGSEPFLFFVNAEGEQVGASYAKDYITTARFQYDYEPGFGEAVIKRPKRLLNAAQMAPVKGVLKGNSATMMLSAGAIKNHLADDAQAPLIALVTLPRPTEASPARDFDVLVGAPDSVKDAGPESPYYAGTVAFFGGIMHMPGMSGEATFLVPLPKRAEAFKGLGAGPGSVPVNIRVVPSGGGASVLKAVTVRAL